MRKRKLLMIDMYPTSLAYKLLYILKDYFEITLIVLQNEKNLNHLLEDYNSLGIKIYYFDVNNKKKDLFKLVLRLITERFKGYKFVLGKSGPNWPTYLIFKLFTSSKKIYFPYDIFLFLCKNPRTRPRMGVFFEKSNFKNADFIIHKCPEDVLNLIRKDEVKKIRGKPIQFLPCLDEWMVPITKKKTNDLSIVYVGAAPKDDPSIRKSWNEVFKQISKQGITVHVYPLKMAKIQEFEKLHEKNIVYHEPISNKTLNKEISKYHYGLGSGAFFDEKLVDERMLKTGLGNKFLSCLEAGIPIIIDDYIKFSMDLVKKYNCGIVVPEKDIPNLRKIIEKQSYAKLLKGVKKAREEFKMSKLSKKLIEELNLKGE